MIVEDFMIYNNSAITKEIPYIGQLEEYFANCEKEGKKNGISDDSIVKNALHLARTKGQDYCHLVSYIANYPSRYPVPKQEEQDEKMERLLEESDILPTYLPWDDLDGIFIRGTDIIRLETALISCFDVTQELIALAKDEKEAISPTLEEEVRQRIEIPKTREQQQGKSYRISMKDSLRTLRGGK